MSIDLLCTLGPASMNDRVIARLEELGATLFRINLSHTALEDLPRLVEFVQERTNVPLCLDTEGAQVRNGKLIGGAVDVREHNIIDAVSETILGDNRRFSLYPEYVVDALEIGDFISIDFNAVLVQVIDKTEGRATLRVLNGGKMGQNKAVTVERIITMPPLTEKDEESIKIGRNMGVKHFALSFANFGKDVDFTRELAGPDTFIISKIECRNGLINLDDIIQKSDAILIDRGDLSREVPIERIPSLQRKIIQQAKSGKTLVYVATNLLESMITNPGPTRAEVNDVFYTLVSGADGLVLAAETAIGDNPIGCASMIVKLVHAFETDDEEKPTHYPDDPKSLLIDPHGGMLVHREATTDDKEGMGPLRQIKVSDTDLMDAEQIALGTYSPLTGFMGSEQLASVLDDLALPTGVSWTMPILLPLPDGEDRPSKGERIVLCSEAGTPHFLLDVSEIYTANLEDTAKKWFGTRSDDHPGVANLKTRGDTFIAGDVQLLERIPSPYRHYELPPAQTRFVFTHKGWNRVVGFHTRNPAHRVHEHIQLDALQSTHADGLYISPVIGPKKAGDFLPGPIMKSYQILIEEGVYPEGKVTLGSFSTYPRYSGPREALFTALCRKNMGCSHFIVGRDHTGVGDFYGPDDNLKMFERAGEIGIKPVFFDAIGYSPDEKDYVVSGPKVEVTQISGTEARNALRDGEELPEWFMRQSVQNMLRDKIKSGKKIFY